jgi:hypothetical protein
LADEESSGTKLIVLGINNAGRSLINFAHDLVSRVSIIRMGTTSDDKVRTLVAEGAAVLNCDLPITEIVRHSGGSFQVAQMLAQRCCIASGITEAQIERRPFNADFEKILNSVMDNLALRYADVAMDFAAGPSLNREGRAPYLHLLKWLSESREGSITLNDQLLNRHPNLQSSITTTVSGGHLLNHVNSKNDFSSLIHFDSRNRFLSIENPQFHFYLKHLDWSRFAMRVGFVNIEVEHKYDFALSFARDRRRHAAYLSNNLKLRELSVFFDSDEQDRILATDVEEYLARIYKSDATFVVCFISPEYPERVWTRFESKQFQARFGTESVIPITGGGDMDMSMFDTPSQVGYFPLIENQPLEPQLDDLTDLLSKKITAMRARPKTKPGEFYCIRCWRILPEKVMAPHKVNICLEDA